ncbi:MAG: hypothetical protein HQK77_12405 [Desulfobacterales bacterium]|nr:hypothetical protein [Desulfobacterales bacterium]
MRKILLWIIVCVVVNGLSIIVPLSAEVAVLQPVHTMVNVAIVPFKINADKNLSFLSDGIYDILAFELAATGRVHVIHPDIVHKAFQAYSGFMNEDVAKSGAELVHADYIIFGSLVALANQISLHAYFIDASGKQPSFILNRQLDHLDRVLPEINQYVKNIKVNYFQSGEPEMAEKTDIDRQLDNQKMNQNAILPLQTKQLWKSKVFNDVINGIEIADINQDGKQETLVMMAHEVLLIKFGKEGMISSETLFYDKYCNFIGIDVADINMNGSPEIYLSGLNAHKNSVRSYVLEYNGKDYIAKIKKSSWFFKVISQQRQKLLLGQEMKRQPYPKEFFVMTWQNNELITKTQLVHSNGVNILGVTCGDVLNDSSDVFIAYNSYDQLHLFDFSGKILWDSKEKMGGSPLYVEWVSTEPGETDRIYLPMKVMVRDMDDDGKNEVICIQNDDKTGRLLKRYRQYYQSQVMGLRWDGLALPVTWKGKVIPWQISDFTFGDFNNDRQLDFVVSVIQKDGSTIGSEPSSMLISVTIPKK